MATLRLESYDGNVLELPDLCLKCGAPAALSKSKNFSWFPSWVWVLLFVCGLVPFAIVAAIMTKRRRVEVPLCEEHKNHWMWRQVAILGGLLLVLGLVFGGILLADNQQGGGNDPLSGFLCVAGPVGLIIWLIAIAILQSTAIRPKEITDTSITLVGVSDVFIQAYEEDWRPSPERLDKLASERWNQGKGRPRAERAVDEDADRIQRAEEDEDRRLPPDAYHEGR
ncbi:MAG TPA: hypothetical protein VN688_01655 [Gemmataceae bacterium]|nr:hypothetical protein [Gemmataceae bacterium]